MSDVTVHVLLERKLSILKKKKLIIDQL